MSLFLESIKINNGDRINLEGHNLRMNRTRNRHFHEIRNIDLRNEIVVPEDMKTGVLKCRVIYGRKIESISFERYDFKDPRTFKLMIANDLIYNEKLVERTELNNLFSQRHKADDIIIIKNGFVTDSFYANLCLLKDGKWYTPLSPLLEGTHRAKLVEEGKVIPTPISISDIFKFEALKIVNALTQWSMHKPVPMDENHIFW